MTPEEAKHVEKTLEQIRMSIKFGSDAVAMLNIYNLLNDTLGAEAKEVLRDNVENAIHRYHNE